MNETEHDLVEQNRALIDVIQKMVNGATGSMGVNSIGREYAHITQNVLDVGREVLRQAGRPCSEPTPYVDTAAKYGLVR